MPSKPIGIGVIGTGFGVRVQIPVWANTPGAKVVGICSSNLSRAQTIAQRFSIPHATTSPEELASLKDVDLVSVTTPPYLHNRGVMAAIQAGRHILCEKPFAMDEHDAAQMLNAARNQKVIHLVNFEFRTLPAREKMQQMIHEGFLGSLTNVISTGFGNFVNATEGRTARWWYQKKTGGGWLGASGSHDIDALRFFFGEIAAVSAQLKTAVKQHKVLGEKSPINTDVDDTFYIMLRLANGAVAALLSSAATATSGTPKRLEAYGSKGTIILEGDRLFAGEKGDSALKEVNLPTPDVPMDNVDPHYIPFGLWTRRIVLALQKDRQIAPSFEDGLKSQLVIDAARKSSAQDGCWVPIAN